MTKKENESKEHPISWKTKGAIIVIWAQLLMLTWLIINSNNRLWVQTMCFIMTVITLYLHIVILQDYFYLKLHKGLSNIRRDIRIIEPLIPKRIKKNDNQA